MNLHLSEYGKDFTIQGVPKKSIHHFRNKKTVLTLQYSIYTDNKRWTQVTYDFCNYNRCSNWLPSASRHFWLWQTTAWGTLNKVSILSWMCAILRRVGGSVAYPHLHCHCTSTFEHHFKMVLHSSKDNRSSAIFFDCPACCMVTLAFIWLTPSFERTPYYTLLP